MANIMEEVHIFNNTSEWLANAIEKYHVYVNDHTRLASILHAEGSTLTDAIDIDADISVDPQVINLVANLEQYRGRELTIISWLGQTYYLARTFQDGVLPYEAVNFVVLDEANVGQLVFEFEWPLDVHVRRRSSRFGHFVYIEAQMANAHFICQSSCCHGYTVLVGPPTKVHHQGNGRTNVYPQTKVLFTDSWHIKDIDLQNGTSPIWPLQVTCHPRPHQEHLTLMLCTDLPSYVVSDCSGGLQGFPVLYDIRNEQVLSIFSQTQLTEGVLHFLRDGQSFVALETLQGGKRYKMWQIGTSGFEVQRVLPLDDFRPPVSSDDSVSSSILWSYSLESACGQWCMLLMTFRDERGQISIKDIKKRGKVCCVKLPPSKVLSPLKNLCVTCILTHLQDPLHNIDVLPLPKSLKENLKGGKD